ncbi:MAG: hypothetical protein ACOY3L_02760 [Pseudomonadota bacterium]
MVSLAAALAFIQCAEVRGEDILLLRDGTDRRGALASCGEVACRIDSVDVPRSTIEWIGFGRASPSPPPVTDPTRDELHLTDKSVESASLKQVDSMAVHTVVGSYPRTRVAWIHLARPDGTESAAREPPADGWRTEPESAESDALVHGSMTDPWRLPRTIFIWAPPDCAECDATLHVLHLEARRDTIVLARSRSISVWPESMNGHWWIYDPPIPLFPGTITTESSVEDKGASTWVIEEYFSVERTHASADPDGEAPRDEDAPDASSGAADADAPIHPLDRPIYEAAERVSEAWQGWARDRMARDRAAQSGGRSAPPSDGSYQAHSIRFGAMSSNNYLRVTNWQATASAYLRAGAADPRYLRLAEIPVYDVELRLDFNWRDYRGHARDVDPDGFTTDWRLALDTAEPVEPVAPSVSYDQPGADAPDEGSLLGQAAEAMDPALAPIREMLERDRAARQARRSGDPDGPAPNPCGGTTAPQPAEEPEPDDQWGPFAAADRALSEAARDVVERASEPLREILDRDRARRTPTADGDGSAPCDEDMSVGLPAHAIWLGMRWYRAEGRITPNYFADIIRDAVEGRVDAADAGGLIVSATKPPQAFDLESPPSWPSANPRPPDTIEFDAWRP